MCSFRRLQPVVEPASTAELPIARALNLCQEARGHLRRLVGGQLERVELSVGKPCQRLLNVSQMRHFAIPAIASRRDDFASTSTRSEVAYLLSVRREVPRIGIDVEDFRLADNIPLGVTRRDLV